MIPKAYIDEWRQFAPWQDNYQVEQDLIISRAINAIYAENNLREKLAFRGGTALHKLYIQNPARYSEDIDLVQIQSEPFGPVMDQLRDCLSFLGTPTRKQKEHNNTMIYRFESNEGLKMKLKIEVNTREHFTVFGYQQIPFEVPSSWHRSKESITSFTLEELLSTKLRALYQRKKGRDLFDLWYAITHLSCRPELILESWRRYLNEEKHSITKKEFESNLDAKMQSSQFTSDMNFLIRKGIDYNVSTAMDVVHKTLIKSI